ncbi:hypothetical protein QE152_g32490 [Popillia japonica]|uniref:Uncharacterized protein n=1 Tax=Popillia japonica TaxID=7064 RepID=A0AAW1IYL1_POPJA
MNCTFTFIAQMKFFDEPPSEGRFSKRANRQENLQSSSFLGGPPRPKASKRTARILEKRDTKRTSQFGISSLCPLLVGKGVQNVNSHPMVNAASSTVQRLRRSGKGLYYM